MKILIITKLFPYKNRLAGIFNKIFLDFFNKKYPDINFKIIRSIPFFYNIFKFNETYFYNENYQVYYPKILSFGPFLLNFHHFFYFYRILNFIKKNNFDFDIIHSHWLYPDCYVATKIGKIFNKPVIIHCHGSDINYLLFNKSLTEYNKWTLFNADKILVVSYALKNKILSLYPELNDKIEVFYNSIDLKKYQNIDLNYSFDILKIKNDNIKKIIFVGNLKISKGILELLQAAKIIKDKGYNFKIYLIGKNDFPEQKIFLKYIKNNNLNNNIFFIGEIENQIIKHWFNIADFSVLPSYSEGFPLVVLESLTTNTPVIATNVGGIPEILDDSNKGKLIKPKNVEELAESMIDFITNDYKKKLKITNLEKFDINYQSEKLFEIYNKLNCPKQLR